MGKNIRLSQYDSTHAIDWVDAIRHDGQVKGSAKITLTNEKTGRIEQVEHDNIVTDAVKNIFRYNYNMAGSFPDLLPLKKLFGGVLLFRDPVAEPTADMVYPWNENENPMTARDGVNNIFSDTGNSSVEYYADIDLYIAELEAQIPTSP